MTRNTQRIIHAALDADPAVDAKIRAAIVNLLKGNVPTPPQEPEIMRFSEVARLLSVSRRTIVNLIKQGKLRPAYFPGRKNAIGIATEAVRKFVETMKN
jgi:excisionase family DNA binding protein